MEPQLIPSNGYLRHIFTNKWPICKHLIELRFACSSWLSSLQVSKTEGLQPATRNLLCCTSISSYRRIVYKGFSGQSDIWQLKDVGLSEQPAGHTLSSSMHCFSRPAQLALRPEAEAAQAPENPTLFPLLFEELLAGLSKPLCLNAGS